MSFNERIHEIKRQNYYTAPVNEPKFDNPYLLKSDTEALNDILVALKEQNKIPVTGAVTEGSQSVTQGGIVQQQEDTVDTLQPAPDAIEQGDPQDLNPEGILQAWMTGQSEEPGTTFVATAEEGGDGINANPQGFGGGTGLNATAVAAQNLPNAGGANQVPVAPTVHAPHHSQHQAIPSLPSNDPTSVADFPVRPPHVSRHGRDLMEGNPIFAQAMNTPVGSRFNTRDYSVSRPQTDAFTLFAHPGKDLLTRDNTGRARGVRADLPVDSDIHFDLKNKFNEPLTGIVNAAGGQTLSFYYGNPPTLGYDVAYPSGGKSSFGMSNVDGGINERHF